MRYSKALAIALKSWALTLLFLLITMLPFIPIPCNIIGVFLAAITTIIGLFPGTILIKKIAETKLDKSKKIALLLFSALLISNGLGLFGLHYSEMLKYLWTLPLSSIGLIFSILYTMKNNWETNKNNENEVF